MKIFSPATLANFTVGFDFMGLCLDFGDTFEINKLKEEEIRICSNINLPLNPKENICGIVYLKMKKDFSLEGGISIKINKKIPLGSGMGGSATSAVATAYAINKLYNLNLENKDILYYSSVGEGLNGDAHYDNIAPCLLGGFQILDNNNNSKEIKFPNWNIYILYQDIFLNTSESRKKLNPSVSLKHYVKQSKYLANSLIAIQNNDFKCFKDNMKDLIIEDQRKCNIKNYDILKEFLNDNNMVMNISGSGPSIFIISEKDEEEKIKKFTKEKGINSVLIKSSIGRGTYEIY